MQKKENILIYLLKSAINSICISIILTLVLGYIFGYRAIIVIGGSAEPDIHYHSIIVTAKYKPEDLKIGDYVTFSTKGEVNTTHKIVSIDLENDIIVCRGNQYNPTTGQYEEQNTEQVIKYKNIVGKVIYTNYILGTTVWTIRSNMYILIGLFACIMLLLIVREQFKTEPSF